MAPTYRHTVTYTTDRSRYDGCLEEHTTTLLRKRVLTHAGAQRILRSRHQLGDPSLVVVRVEHMALTR